MTTFCLFFNDLVTFARRHLSRAAERLSFIQILQQRGTVGPFFWTITNYIIDGSWTSSIVFDSGVFTNNTAGKDGGGIYLRKEAVNIEDVSEQNNEARVSSSVLVTSCNFTDNYANGNGGAILEEGFGVFVFGFEEDYVNKRVDSDLKSVYRDLILYDNRCSRSGCGIYIAGSDIYFSEEPDSGQILIDVTFEGLDVVGNSIVSQKGNGQGSDGSGGAVAAFSGASSWVNVQDYEANLESTAPTFH
jgi:predicted outer membrane repeat protein